MKKVLYVHGLGGSKNGMTSTMLKDALQNKVIVASCDFPSFPKDYQKKVLEMAENADAIIASSLGVFMTLSIAIKEKLSMPIVLINPALKPSKDILYNFGYGVKEYRKKREDNVSTYSLDDDYYQSLKELEKEMYQALDKCNFVFSNASGIFSDHDEFFHHQDEYVKYINYYIMINDGHHISEENIAKVVVPYLLNKLY